MQLGEGGGDELGRDSSESGRVENCLMSRTIESKVVGLIGWMGTRKTVGVADEMIDGWRSIEGG